MRPWAFPRTSKCRSVARPEGDVKGLSIAPDCDESLTLATKQKKTQVASLSSVIQQLVLTIRGDGTLVYNPCMRRLYILSDSQFLGVKRKGRGTIDSIFTFLWIPESWTDGNER